ncbi:hypothetical protein B296_00054577 [Ensete ventricosum]|uniref:Uncharacterized protein n=1 Tax=Ensete ventricosum TaxID=4639 RepID=A0A426X3T9_ENSVE|nr:hypothetical protein B296_00054577 [Ensete ventricosum]
MGTARTYRFASRSVRKPLVTGRYPSIGVVFALGMPTGKDFSHCVSQASGEKKSLAGDGSRERRTVPDSKFSLFFFLPPFLADTA